MNRCTAVFLGATTGVVGFMLGLWAHIPGERPAVTGSMLPIPVAVASIPAPSQAVPTSSAGDCQSVKTQLAICMAYHPTSDERDRELTMCRADLDLHRQRPTLPSCYDFMDMASIYDRELGEADPSPETMARAGSLSTADCVKVITWAGRAGRQQETCLKGRTPPGFKERYGSPVRERPFVKACRRTDAVNAYFEREEERGREVGYELPFNIRVRAEADGGLLFPGTDGGMAPWVPEGIQ